MPPMMTNDENPHRIAGNAEKKMVRETMEVDAAKVALADGERLGPLGCVEHEAA